MNLNYGSMNAVGWLLGYGRHMGDWITAHKKDDKDELRFAGYYLEKE